MASEYWFPWYPAHYRRDAGHLDHVADSCYRRLLDWYMETGEPIKKDAAKLMHIMGVSAPQFQAVWPQIEGFFSLTPRGYLHHKRCDVELDRQDAETKRKSAAGQRSAEKRKQLNGQLQLLTDSSSTAVVQPFRDLPTAVPPKERKGKEVSLRDAGASPEASPPPDPKAMLFTALITWLATLNGKDPSKYRSTVGMWLRDHGDIKTLQAFVEAQKENPQGDRVAYMERLLRPRPKRIPQI